MFEHRSLPSSSIYLDSHCHEFEHRIKCLLLPHMLHPLDGCEQLLSYGRELLREQQPIQDNVESHKLVFVIIFFLDSIAQIVTLSETSHKVDGLNFSFHFSQRLRYTFKNAWNDRLLPSLSNWFEVPDILLQVELDNHRCTVFLPLKHPCKF